MKGSKKVVSLLLSIFIIFPILVSFISCSDNSFTEPARQDDEFLKKAIIGSWTYEGEKITFNEDGTYTASTSFRNGNTSEWTTQFITKGAYKIADGMLYYYNVQYLYMTDRTGALIGEGYPAVEIRIADNRLSLIGVDIYTSDSKTDGIYGHWETTKWAASYNSKPEYSGYIKCSYDLDQTSSTFFRYIKFLDDPAITPIEDRDLFVYEAPNLKMISAGQSVVNYTVELKNGKMYWYYENKKPFFLYKE